jgi:hypothetical protein
MFESTAFEDFKNHIIEKHEEGRDYIVCPLARCRTPVRDLVSHFKAKHPTEKMPIGVQLKATVWRDPKKPRGKGKFKETVKKFKSGSIISNKMNGKVINYRSGYEREVCGYLELLPEVVAYDVETIKIPYWFQGKRYKYIPDFQIVMTNGGIEIWEVKPATQTTWPKNEAKWKAAEEYCRIRGWKFMVLTEVGMGKLKHKVRRLNG